MVMRVAIVGCGLIGHKRARALGDCRAGGRGGHRPGTARQLAGPASRLRRRGRLAGRPSSRADVDLVIVATTNDALAPVTLAAVRQGKHVLVEKPAARNAAELAPAGGGRARPRAWSSRSASITAFTRPSEGARALRRRAAGPLMYIRGRYGHGGRLGYDREWRADPAIAGGGELLDQGVHLIDLARWFLGDFPRSRATSATFFWDMPVDDNAFLSLRTAGGPGRPGCTPAAPSGRTCSASRSSAATASCRSTAWAAATAWSG